MSTNYWVMIVSCQLGREGRRAPVDLRHDAGSTSSSSGTRSLADYHASRLASPPACHRRSADGGSVKLAACEPSAPAPLSGRYLSFAEREEIAILNARGSGVREIASPLGRSPSTISRELRRNAATRGGTLEYRAINAQWHADRRAKRPQVAKLAANDALS